MHLTLFESNINITAFWLTIEATILNHDILFLQADDFISVGHVFNIICLSCIIIITH